MIVIIVGKVVTMRSLIVLVALLLVPHVANAGLHGGIEIGSRGVKVVVLEFTPLPDEVLCFATLSNGSKVFDWAYWRRVEVR